MPYGIIPAYAGNTEAHRAGEFDDLDHPRVCGEHSFRRNYRCCAAGSSPRMRGTLPEGHVVKQAVRIIPAYAGNTYAHLFALSCHRDHPRVCGEHDAGNPLVRGTRGSSPRMRGTLSAYPPRSSLSGIIPAYAGNTLIIRCISMLSRDHPRVCGEHMVVHRCGRLSMGSSPRMRGTPQSPTAFGKPHGIIPAYAGNTRMYVRFSPFAWDHPRVCGEHW